MQAVLCILPKGLEVVVLHWKQSGVFSYGFQMPILGMRMVLIEIAWERVSFVTAEFAEGLPLLCATTTSEHSLTNDTNCGETLISQPSDMK